METLKELKNLDADNILSALGLQRKIAAADNVLPVVGIFGAGLVIGAALGLLLAPGSGRETRKRLQRGMEDVRDRVVSTANSEELGVRQ